MSDAGRTFALDARTYRWTDRLTKLLGVALVAVGLEVGGGSLAGTSSPRWTIPAIASASGRHTCSPASATRTRARR